LRQFEYDFKPPPKVHTAFLDDFEKLLSTFESAGMEIIPVLCDYAFFDEPKTYQDEKSAQESGGRRFGLLANPQPGTEPTDGNYFKGRRAVATNPSYRKIFLDGTLKPLVAVAAKHKDIVYAFDIINEPSICTAPFTGDLFGESVSLEPMMTFLRDCADTIRQSKLPVTIGNRVYDDDQHLWGVRIDRPQFHYYAQFSLYDVLPSLSDWRYRLVESPPWMPKADKPFLGEFGSIIQSEVDQAKKAGAKPGEIEKLQRAARPWPQLHGSDNTPQTVIPERLTYLRQQGYALALIWPSVIETPDDFLKLRDEKLKSVKEWVGKNPP
jgi:hypothetical protein